MSPVLLTTRLAIKKGRNKENYEKLAREVKYPWSMKKVDVIPVVLEALATLSQFKHIKVCLRPSLQSSIENFKYF